jgi:predicted ATP-grasp superfamily ATP-dependent carboligase
MVQGTAFVTDAQMRSSLAVIRSLGRQGLRVTAGEETMWSTGFLSKYCREKVVYPAPKMGEKFIENLIPVLERGDYDVIFPVADACLKPIIENEREISQYTQIALPSPPVFQRGYDKGLTLQIAMENGIPCPETHFPRSVEELPSILEGVQYPVVLKPRVGSGRRGVTICESPEEAALIYRRSVEQFGPMLIQEYIPYGGELGVYALVNRNCEMRAVTVQRRLRSYPIDGGPSTLRETIRNELSETAIDLAYRLLRAMRWFGVAMVEFRIDERDGSLKLMEVNPRFWGSLQLSILSGVDFPYLLYKMMIEGDVAPVLDYKPGVQCRWLLPGEILWYLSSPQKLKNLRELLRFDIPDDIISWSDPGPTLGFVLATLRYSMDREMWRFVLRR